MNILYIGEAGEAGVRLTDALSRTNTVFAAFSKKPVYETNCETVPSTADIGAVIREKKIDAVICAKGHGASVEDTERLLSAVAGNDGCCLYYIKEQSFFRRRETTADAAAWLCEGFARRCGIKTVFISTSCLYAPGKLPAYLQKLLKTIDRHRELYPGGAADEYCDCLHVDDFCGAMETILKTEHENEFEQIELQSAYPFLLSEFIDSLSQRYNGLTVQEYEAGQVERTYTAYQSESWTPRHSFTDDLPSLLDGVEDHRLSLQRRRRKAGVNIAMKLGVFTVLFLGVELYTRMIAVSSDLQFVDMRLLFVVVASLLIGKRYGIAAAALCSIASVIQSIFAGYHWYVLFYHVDNWIPIAAYFIAAILLGLYQDNIKRHIEENRHE